MKVSIRVKFWCKFGSVRSSWFEGSSSWLRWFDSKKEEIERKNLKEGDFDGTTKRYVRSVSGSLGEAGSKKVFRRNSQSKIILTPAGIWRKLSRLSWKNLWKISFTSKRNHSPRVIFNGTLALMPFMLITGRFRIFMVIWDLLNYFPYPCKKGLQSRGSRLNSIANTWHNAAA